MYELKEKLKHELYAANAKDQLTPADLDMIKKISESLYYITAACAMEEGVEDDYSGRRMYSRDNYSNDYSGRRRNSLGQYSRDNYSRDGYARDNYSRNGYSMHDLESKRMFLEEMMAEARTESERESFRKKLDELNRQM